MPEAGTCTERELIEPVDLCTPDGRLNPDAIGWSRQPLHDCALPGSWGRRKRWDFWGITAPGVALNLVYADADYVGIADVWFRDLSAGRSVEKSVPTPLARGMALPDSPGGAPIEFDRGGLALSLVEEAAGTRIRIAFAGKASDGGSGDFSADLVVQRPDGHESLSVVIPWGERRFQFTNKDVARPTVGTISWDGESYELSADGAAWGCLDFGRGKWPYRTTWNWGAGAGVVNGPDGRTTVGVQLGGKWTDGTGMTENALCIDGRLSKLSEELVWTYDPSDWLRPWTIRTPRSERVDLTFTPVYDKRARLQAGVAAQATDQCFGTYSGTVVPDDGRVLAIDGLNGWAEEASWRW
ncbi:MAG: DUF2804 domain-containing protein [Acidimicrobiales bacterium]|nr:DUF2804 domain-containing protein [Acidimicrobiales bacterium]